MKIKNCLTCKHAFPAGLSTIYCEDASITSVVLLVGGKLISPHDDKEVVDCQAHEPKSCPLHGRREEQEQGREE